MYSRLINVNFIHINLNFLNIGDFCFQDPSTENQFVGLARSLNPIQKKRDVHSYQRLMRIANGYRGFSPGASNREAAQHVSNPIRFWKTRFGNGAKRNEREGMTISVTHNLDILRRRLLKEIALRERQRNRKELMMKNKGILGNIGK